MPSVLLPIPETYVNLQRAAALDVIKQVRDIAKIDDKKMRVTYRGWPEASKSFNSSDGGAKTSDSARFSQTGKLTVSVNEIYDETGKLTTSTHRNNLCLFNDPKLDIEIRPVYMPMEVEINFSYRAEDHQAAESFRNYLQQTLNMASAQSEVNAHELSYEYPLPKEYLMILHKLYEMRENVAGYGQSFKEWFNAHCSPKATILTTRDAGSNLLVFRENQLNVYGWFEINEAPPKQKGPEGSVYTVDFTYRFRYEKPMQMAMQYPQSIHNQELPPKYLGSTDDYKYRHMVGDLSLDNQQFDYFRKLTGFWTEQFDGIRIPYYDDVVLDPRNDRMANVMTVRYQVSPQDPHAVFAITDLEQVGYKFYPRWLEFFREYRNDLTHIYANPFHIQIWRDGFPLPPEDILIDENLNIRTAVPQNLRKTYRLSITLLTDLTLIDKRKMDALRERPLDLRDIIAAIDPKMKIDNLLPPIKRGKITAYDLGDALKKCKTVNTHFKRHVDRPRAHIGQFTICTKVGE